MELERVSQYSIRTNWDRLRPAGVKHAIVAAPELSQSQFAAVIEQGSYAFPHLNPYLNTHSFWKVGAHSMRPSGDLGNPGP